MALLSMHYAFVYTAESNFAALTQGAGHFPHRQTMPPHDCNLVLKFLHEHQRAGPGPPQWGAF